MEEKVDSSVIEERDDLIQSMNSFDSVSDDIYLHVYTPPLSPLDDVFNISDICLLEMSVNFDFHTYNDVTLDLVCTLSPSPIPEARVEISMETIDLMYRDPDLYIFGYI